jgi:hypothetical protein
MSILAVRYAAARGRSRGVPPLGTHSRAVSHPFRDYRERTNTGKHFTIYDPLRLFTIRYFMDTRRRRGRKSDAEPIDW